MAEKLATPDGAPVDIGPAADAEPDAEWVDHMREAARTADETEHAAPAKKDADAPYGRKADGTPKKRPGRSPKNDAASKPRVQRRSKTAAPTSGGEPKDYRPQLDDAFTGAWGVACIGNQADAGAIYVSKPALIQTCNAAAQQSPTFARGVEFVTSYTAVGMAIGSLALLGLQFAVNHGRVEAKSVAHLGIRSPEELERINLGAMTAMAEEMQAAQAAAQAEKAQAA